ncbi:unnamed protein product [Rotaria sordida]|uniref:Uncharacterized protein n=2 Tax=Rotaria sordida TaxID=392033 RepID=A0A820H7Z0_9BILA|nr:unnamed protein product [Rotaria sordida]
MSIEEKHDEDFTIFPNILDENSSSKKKKDLYRLPEWMSSLAKRFDSSGQLQTDKTIPINQIDYLDEDIRSILINDLSIQYLFPVQSQVIPYLIQQN